MFQTITWKNNQVIMIDQRKLPTQEVYITHSTYKEVAASIKTMVIRGAPAIGVAAAMGLALGALKIEAADFNSFYKQLEQIADDLFKTRPTAVNLGWALDRMKMVARDYQDKKVDEIKQILTQHAQLILEEDIKLNKQIGEHGQTLLQDGDRILTHCNAGALATGGFGTALGVIYAAQNAGKNISVLADETRPFLQGARLTAWELHKNQVPVTLITDNMAAWLMKKGDIDKIIVGADRIAANGDVANKIGTYNVALLAKHHNIPFYVAAPLSTIDLKTPSGETIPIEERPFDEVTHIKGQQITPDGVTIRNPAFDVTPNELVTAIITEKGIAQGDYTARLKQLF